MKSLSILLVMVSLIAGMLGCDGIPSEGSEIRTWYGLDAIRDNLDGNYVLMNDLDSTSAGYGELASSTANEGKGWAPIGSEESPFVGSLDGQGYEIRDLFAKRPDEDLVGLFGCVDEGARIEDLGVVNADVTGDWFVGGLVGVNGASSPATVDNSYATGRVTGQQGVGGLVGVNALGTVSDSYSMADVTGEESVVGGLVGASVGNVSNSYYNYDEVLINGEHIISIGAMFDKDFEEWLANDKFLDVNNKLSQEGGYYLINNVSDFKQLLAFGQDDTLKFRLTDDLDLGGDPSFYIPYLAGEFDGSGHRISNLSFSFGLASSVGLFGCLAPGGKVTHVGVENMNITAFSVVGGLVGSCRGTVISSYSTGNVTGNYHVGGLVGGNVFGGTVSNSYSTGNITGNYPVGGLVGYNDLSTVNNCYAAGNVSGDDDVGGLVGYSAGSSTTNSFWDTQTSGQLNSAGGTGKNTTEMQDIATFLGVGWDIIAVPLNETNPAYIWNIVNNITYPFLSWQSIS